MGSNALSRGLWLAPLAFFQLYLLGSVVLFFWGPWPWQPAHPDALAAYLLLAQAAMAAGYFWSWDRVQGVEPVRASPDAPQGFLRAAAFVTLLLVVPTSLSRTGLPIPDVIAGITNAGEVYNQNFERLAGGNPYVAVEYVRILLAPLLVGLLPLTIVYWGTLSTALRIACLAGCAFHLAMYIATGTNKGIADFAVTAPWLVWLGIRTGTLKAIVSRRTVLLAIGLVFALFLAFFGAGQAQREGGVGELGVFNTGSELIYARRDEGLSLHLGEAQRIIWESLTRYLGQGYYATSLTMDIDHESTLGAGHSMFLARNADALFNTDFFTQRSLPGLLEEVHGWPMQGLWHSIYPWLASDVGFGGTLLVLAAFGWLLGLAWGRALQGAGPAWVVLAWLMLVLFYYVPANNQVFQTAETCAAFFILAISVLLTTRERVGRPGQAPLADAQGPPHPAC
ncbi:hypothetical protein [Ramlibacter algicola]|uniref:Oligosaccharide repeat unit polymerase n=1 Tax=Ramlibacter algicola TaxID=2795217 RepID=A0A934UQL4_9BURK|nr:hypothetical protein [Ramlibacter algicola]MBK0391946.1 hypothetical protein [Ramlibacter algicola]